MQVFSRVALVHSPRQIFISGLFAQQEGRGQDQAIDVFDQLQNILDQTGSDLRHMAKATYYVCDDDSARGMDRVRLWRYDQDRPPAASKCLVHGVGHTSRTLTMDMIAVGVSMVSVLSERRLNRLLHPALSVGLPAFLTKGAGM